MKICIKAVTLCLWLAASCTLTLAMDKNHHEGPTRKLPRYASGSFSKNAENLTFTEKEQLPTADSDSSGQNSPLMISPGSSPQKSSFMQSSGSSRRKPSPPKKSHFLLPLSGSPRADETQESDLKSSADLARKTEKSGESAKDWLNATYIGELQCKVRLKDHYKKVTTSYAKYLPQVLNSHVLLINASLGINKTVRHKDTIVPDEVRERIAELTHYNDYVLKPLLQKHYKTTLGFDSCVTHTDVDTYIKSAEALVQKIEQERIAQASKDQQAIASVDKLDTQTLNEESELFTISIDHD